jgi:hypothetical protein
MGLRGHSTGLCQVFRGFLWARHSWFSRSLKCHYQEIKMNKVSKERWTMFSSTRENRILLTFFLASWRLNSGPYTRQVCSHFSHAPSPFCFSYFQIGSHLFLLVPAWTIFLPHTASHIAGTTGSHTLTDWDGISLAFCPDQTQTVILPISASQVAGITGVSPLHLALTLANF